MVVAAPAIAGTKPPAQVIEYRGFQTVQESESSKSDTASNNAIGYYVGQVKQNDNEKISPYAVKGAPQAPLSNTNIINTSKTLSLLFGAWQNKHVELLSDTINLSANLTYSIGLTESYLKATRSHEDYRKFFATYLLFLKTSYEMIDTNKAIRLSDIVSDLNYLDINVQSTQTFFNRVSSLGLAIY